jgi:hypothetical protein
VLNTSCLKSACKQKEKNRTKKRRIFETLLTASLGAGFRLGPHSWSHIFCRRTLNKLEGVNDCHPHCHLAILISLMIRGKSGAVIGLNKPIPWNLETGHMQQENGFTANHSAVFAPEHQTTKCRQMIVRMAGADPPLPVHIDTMTAQCQCLPSLGSHYMGSAVGSNRKPYTLSPALRTLNLTLETLNPKP